MDKQIIFLLSIFFLLPLVSAVEIDMESNLSQGETLIARVSGSFFEPIADADITFHRDHVRVPMLFSMEKINEDFYIYAQLLGKQPGNYSMTIEDVKYYQINEILEEDLVKTFTISEDFSDFSITPGFISTNEDFFIEVQNLKNEEITVSSKLSNGTEKPAGFLESLFGGLETDSLSSITLKSGEKKKMNFAVSIFNQGLNSLELKTENTIYKVPVFVFGEQQVIIPDSEFSLDPSDLNVSFSSNSNTTRIIHLFNNGEESIKNISISLSDSLKLHAIILTETIDELDKNSSEKIEVVFIARGEEEVVEGQIKIDSEDLALEVEVFLNILDSYVSPEGGKVASCSELAGDLCSEGQTCKGQLELTSDGNCCIGSCQDKTSRNSTGIIFGWILILAVLGYGIWFYLRKYKKVGRIVDILKIATGKK